MSNTRVAPQMNARRQSRTRRKKGERTNRRAQGPEGAPAARPTRIPSRNSSEPGCASRSRTGRTWGQDAAGWDPIFSSVSAESSRAQVPGKAQHEPRRRPRARSPAGPGAPRAPDGRTHGGRKPSSRPRRGHRPVEAQGAPPSSFPSCLPRRRKRKHGAGTSSGFRPVLKGQLRPPRQPLPGLGSTVLGTWDGPRPRIPCRIAKPSSKTETPRRLCVLRAQCSPSSPWLHTELKERARVCHFKGLEMPEP